MSNRFRIFARCSRFAAVLLLTSTVLAPRAGEAVCPPRPDVGPYALPAGPDVTTLAVGDFDGDGIDDIAMIRSFGLYVLFGATDDRPGQPVSLPLPGSTSAIAAMPDHDGDGRDELAVHHSVPGQPVSYVIEILGFAPDRTPATVGSILGAPAGMDDLVAEDFDGDGDVDLAGLASRSFRMYEQVGPWSFALSNDPAFLALASIQHERLALGDFDGNGRNDLAFVQFFSNNFRLALFPPSGMNALVVTNSTPTRVREVATADIDGDGRDDLVLSAAEARNHDGFKTGDPDASVLSHIDPFVYVYQVVGASMTLQATLPAEFSLTMSTAGDIDQDGQVDIVHGYSFESQLHWFRGSGGFAFAPVAPLTGGSTGGSFWGALAWADLDHDGQTDAVIGNDQGATLAGYLTGAPFVSALDCESTPTGPEDVVLAELDGDGDRDFAVLSRLDAAIACYRGDGSGTNWSRVDVPIELHPRGFVAADCDGDGIADLLSVHGGSPGRLVVRRADGAGGYLPPLEYATPDGPQRILAADLDHDGNLDVVVLANAPVPTRVYRGDGAGGFVGVADFPMGYALTDALLGDLDRDGLWDLVVCGLQGEILMARGILGGEYFAPPVMLGITGAQVDLLDANGDSRTDLAAAGIGEYGQVILGLEGGGFSERIPFLNAVGLRELRAADFDGDGNQDLIAVAQPAVTAVSTGALHLLRGGGDGTFAPAGVHGVGRDPVTFALGDVTGDQRPDVVLSQRDDNSVFLAANIFSGTVDVPAVPRSSALFSRVAPSPSFGAFGVELTGRPDQSVRVELYDVAGRKVGTPRVTQLGADGRGRLALDAGGRPGVYFVRSTQGTDVHVTRAVVLP